MLFGLPSSSNATKVNAENITGGIGVCRHRQRTSR